MKNFLNTSEIRFMEFKPWWLALNGHFQCAMYLFYEIKIKLSRAMKYEREMFKFSDGG